MFKLKHNVSEAESNGRFREKCENNSAKQKGVSDAAFKAWLFYLILPVKMIELPQQLAYNVH